MSLLDDVSIVVTPNGYKAGTLYGVLPTATLGSEQVTNGNFATDSDWTKGSSWSISGGKANYDAVTTASELRQLMSSIAVGKIIKIQFDILDVQAGKDAFFKLEIDGSPEAIFGYTTFSAGTYTYYHTIANAFDRLSFFPLNTSTGGAFSIDNVSVKEFTSSDMDVTRATAATRVDENGLVNYAEVLGSDLITNGDFSSNITGWGNNLISTVPDIAWNNGKARITNTTGSSYNTGINTTNDPFNGLTGIVKVTGNIQIISGSAGTWTAREHYGTTATFVLDGSGNFEVILSLDGTSDDLALYTYTSNLVFDIDNIVAKQITRDNVPRIDYTGGGCPHILAEPQSTNLATYSEDFTQSYWSKINGVTVTSSTIISPDGVSLAQGLQFDGTDNGRIEVNVGSYSNLTQSVYLKVASGTASVQIGFTGGSQLTVTVTNEWQRFEYFQASGTFPRVRCNDNKLIYVWGLQVEEQSYATSYIPTSGSSVTRNQDIFTRDGIGSLIGQTEGTFFIELSKPVLEPDSYYLISLNNAASNADSNSVTIGFDDASDDFYIRLKASGINAFIDNNRASLANTFYKIAVAYKTGQSKIYINGSPITPNQGSLSNAFTFAVTLDNLSFDYNGNGTFPFRGNVRQLQVYKTALTDTQLAALTT